jgi:hypothetical protein
VRHRSIVERGGGLAASLADCLGSTKEEFTMGLFDKLKGAAKGREEQIKSGIDKVADVVESKTPDSVDSKVEMAAEKAKDIVDKLD